MMSTPKHHGMLFADRLMPSMLDGSKTQTRRPVDLKHVLSPAQRKIGFEVCDDSSLFHRTRLAEGVPRLTIPTRHPDDHSVPWVDCGGECLYAPWSVGDLIWCRECWAEIGDEDEAVPREFVYRADGGEYSDWESVDGDKFRWYPSIHMPKWACRCWKEITDVRVQRIQEISEEDAIAEGADKQFRTSVLGSAVAHITDSYRGGFANSWSRIYPGSWERNDWVWALTFKPAESQ